MSDEREGFAPPSSLTPRHSSLLRRNRPLSLSILCGLTIVVPLALYLTWPRLPALGRLPEVESGGRSYPSSPISFARQTVGPAAVGLPRISNVQLVDLDGSGRPQVLVCDASRHQVLLYRRTSTGDWDEDVLGRDLPAPAHATLCDLDGDGDQDVVVAVLGNIEPDDRVIGRVVLLQNTGGVFEPKLLLDDVRRVADVQPGDFNGDGKLDLAVAVFGYNRGQILWLENRGELRFRAHELLSAPGAIHVPVADFDADGDLDVISIVSQDEEELWGFENLGEGRFQKRLLFQTLNFDLGSAGLVLADLDNDGDSDLIYPAGDNLEDLDPYPQPYHGCFWVENRAPWDFALHRISDFGGTYAAAVGDLNHDGHLDVVLVSMANDWHRREHASIVWLENDGRQHFRTWQIDTEPTHLVTVACGDLNNDGLCDIVAGGLHVRGPFDRVGRVTCWFNGDEKP